LVHLLVRFHFGEFLVWFGLNFDNLAAYLWQFVAVQVGFLQSSLALVLATSADERKIFLDLALVFWKFALGKLSWGFW